MLVKIKHIGYDDDDTVISVLEIMYAEAFKGNVLRLWCNDGDYCDCTMIKQRTYDFVDSSCYVTPSDIINTLFKEGKCEIEAYVVWNDNE